jgi:hypothetical protein
MQSNSLVAPLPSLVKIAAPRGRLSCGSIHLLPKLSNHANKLGAWVDADSGIFDPNTGILLRTARSFSRPSAFRALWVLPS